MCTYVILKYFPALQSTYKSNLIIFLAVAMPFSIGSSAAHGLSFAEVNGFHLGVYVNLANIDKIPMVFHCLGTETHSEFS